VVAGHVSEPCYSVQYQRGAVWFVEADGKKVGRLDPETGTITEFAMPNPAAPVGLPFIEAVPPYLVYTRGATGVLGRVDPRDGSIVEFPVPGTNTHFHALTFAFGAAWLGASDGNIYSGKF